MRCDALDGARLVGFKGTEVLARPFEVDLFFTVPAGTDVKGAVGARTTLTADRDDGRGPMCWHGILAGVRLLHETAERALYRASLVPRLWVLGQHVRSYVHTKKKVDAFAADTLKDGGLSGGDFDFKANGGAYPEEEFVCQYRESHLDFIHRWFEREGLYYYFEHPEGEGGSEKMVIVDDKAQHGPLFGDGHVRYVPAAGSDASAGECLRELSADFRLLPASVLISDYNYANPAAPLAGEKPVSSAGRGKIREYGYRVWSEGEAKRLAQVKAQSIACRELVLSASGTYLGLRAGYTFEVGEGPSDLPAKYLAIEVRHAGAVSGASPLVMRYTGLDPKETYRVDVVAIPANVQYRAPQSTAWPRIYGFENGTVDGPADSDYAQLDDHGRYLVRFKFDASDLPDGSTSTYLRMMQPHGGSPEGWHFPLRKDTEVMVSFQGGDPDRPVIAGVVPNAVTPSPVTRKNHTQNVIRTGGGSYIIMDDQEEQQYIDGFVQVANTGFHMGKPNAFAAKVPPAGGIGPDDEEDFNYTYAISTDGDACFKIGGSWWQRVGANHRMDVKGTGRTRYGSDYTLIVGGKTVENYGGERKTTVAGLYKHYLLSGLEQEITGDGSQLVSANWMHTVGAKNHDVYGIWQTTVSGSWDASFGGAASLAAVGGVTISAPTITLKCGELKITAPAKTLKTTAYSVELYGFKESAGVQKFDAAAVAMSVSGMKRDMTSSALALTGSKIDACGAAVSKSGIKVDICDIKVQNDPTSVEYSAFISALAGLMKLG
jgi:type VI secretion system secreted protein VgrG